MATALTRAARVGSSSRYLNTTGESALTRTPTSLWFELKRTSRHATADRDMGLRFSRRIHLLPGVRLNVSGSGPSVSFGHRGAWYTVGPGGRRTATLGWPGTGLRYTATTGGRTGSRPEPSASGPRQGVPPAPSALQGVGWLVALALATAWALL